MANTLSTRAAGERLGVSKARIIQMINRGQLPALRVGRFFVLDPREVDRLKGRPGPGRPKSNGRKR